MTANVGWLCDGLGKAAHQPEPKLNNELKVKINKVLLNYFMSVETKVEENTNADGNSVSQPIAKPHVVRSPKSTNKLKRAIKDLSEMPYLDNEYLHKREQSFKCLIKMWGLDNL